MHRKKQARPGRASRIVAWFVTTALLLGAGAYTVLYWRPWHVEQAVAATLEPVTTPVQFTTLTSELRLNAQLGFGEITALPITPEMITVLPVVGAEVQLGEKVYEAHGAPVVLFQGTRPFWRDLALGVTDGEDVRQLQQNLIDLGFLRGEATGRFAAATNAAVRAWQRSLGVPQTGVFTPASVVVANSPSIRINQVTAALGDSAVSPGTYSETTLRATATLTDAQASQLTAGTPVVVQLPDGTEIPSELATVAPGGAPTADGGMTMPTATIEFPDQDALAQVGPNAVRVIVRDDANQAATLVVPATALLASADGGYAVEIWDGATIRRVQVQIGLVADARVQVLASGDQVAPGSGGGIAEGDLVVLAR